MEGARRRRAVPPGFLSGQGLKGVPQAEVLAGIRARRAITDNLDYVS